jgi:hypothetical protein
MSKEKYKPQTGLYENKDYQLVPADGDLWRVRFLTGDYPETVIEYGKITIKGEDENGELDEQQSYMTFDFNLISSPDETVTEDTVELQQQAADTLLAIIESAIVNNEGITMKDVI